MPGRVDSTQEAIVAGYRRAGASVHVTSNVRDGYPDLLVGYGGRSYPVECKSVGGKLTKQQEEWHANWRGDVYVAHNVGEALAVIGVEVVCKS